jgi:hypothetical protein
MNRMRSVRSPVATRSLRSLLPRRNATMLRRIVPIAYLVIGILVAAQHHDLTNLTTVGRIATAVLAILLWPLVLVGVNLTIK